ncbi:hypothetical protein ES703_31926 [subsurface metagenome]
MRVEICFDVPRGKSIVVELGKEDSEKVKKWLDEGEGPQVFFPDYEG